LVEGSDLWLALAELRYRRDFVVWVSTPGGLRRTERLNLWEAQEWLRIAATQCPEFDGGLVPASKAAMRIQVMQAAGAGLV
jgi:hypothetical protein